MYCVQNILGYDANDSLFYYNIAVKNRNNTILGLINDLKSYKRTSSFSDWGYPIIQHFFFSIRKISNEFAFFLLCVTAALFHSFSSVLIYKISKHYTSNELSQIISAFWGVNAASVYFNVSGLKETYFVFFVLLSIYSLLNLQFYRFNFKNTLLFIFSTIILFFFRIYIALFVLFVFLLLFCFRKLFYKYFSILLISSFIIAFTGLSLFYRFLPELAYVEGVRNAQLSKSFGTNIFISNIMNFIFAWISPIPAFSYSNKAVNLLVASYSSIKIFISFSAIYYIFFSLQRKNYKYYSLIAFYSLNVLLLIISGVSLDFRFGYPTSFVAFVLGVIGLDHFFVSSKIKLGLFTISPSRIIYAILILCLFLTLGYNL
ncbi:hypothetical protein K7J14_00350 [Treponema zuelzerae]|uniref:Uncharacterized protein n=1 Tax=Teretinema zuelzerae TaxID=156 RepID=A0AAE3EF93_9SPIR|nr:hypothetical protein [Teretinema zuelzerae]MCD1653161.1 hypothetical protein [Teretinema zuelzerae]